jgi:predicted metal-dependent hydrolase
VPAPATPPSAVRRASHAVLAGDRLFPVTIARHRRARRYLLRVTDDGRLRLTVPPRASIAEGLRFAESQAGWISRQWTRLRERACWQTGTPVWFRGQQEPLVVSDREIRLGGERLPRAAEDDDVRGAVQAHLRALAARELPTRCLDLAAGCGWRPSSVSVRNQRSRWGSCSSRRTITLNWRLVQMPPFVADYVMLHELAHLPHPNHSRRFWRAVASVCPEWQSAERWLRRHGRELL